MDYSQFMGIAVKAIQEQQKQIDSLESSNQAAQIATLTTQLAQVQSDFAAYKALTEERMDKIGQLLKTVLPSS